jgi:phosphoglycolate phosphatase
VVLFSYPLKQLVLFDIGGTLVDVHGAGRRAFAEAITKTWNVVDDLSDITFAGATDTGVLRQPRRRHPLAVADEADFFVHLAQSLLVGLTSQPPRVYDGVHECVLAWQQTPQAVLGLVTDNARRCAHIKLARAMLNPNIFTVGGYGDEHHDRHTLASLAKERAEAEYDGAVDVTYLVGDTPNDISAAHSIGAVAVGVTTGPFTRDALLEAGAHIVMTRWPFFGLHR